MNENEENLYEQQREKARTFSSAVYVGGVLAATLLFISFVLTAFPQNAYLTRVIMVIAGLFVGASMLAFPYALNNWIFEKNHRKTTIILYYIEMVFITVNTIVSFVNLLAKVANYAAPEWAVLYEPFSVVSIVYVIFAWGTIMHNDPRDKIQQEKREYQQKRDRLISEKKLKYLESEEGLQDIALSAQREIQESSLAAENKSFFPKPLPWVVKEANTPKIENP